MRPAKQTAIAWKNFLSSSVIALRNPVLEFEHPETHELDHSHRMPRWDYFVMNWNCTTPLGNLFMKHLPCGCQRRLGRPVIHCMGSVLGAREWDPETMQKWYERDESIRLHVPGSNDSDWVDDTWEKIRGKSRRPTSNA